MRRRNRAGPKDRDHLPPGRFAKGHGTADSKIDAPALCQHRLSTNKGHVPAPLNEVLHARLRRREGVRFMQKSGQRDAL